MSDDHDKEARMIVRVLVIEMHHEHEAWVERIAAALRAAHQAGRDEAGAEISAMMRNTELSP